MNLRLITFILALCAGSLHAELAASPAPEAQPAAKTEAPSKTSEQLAQTGNDFLRFALTKAEKYSGKIEDAVGSGVDLAMKEAPETARQFLTWHFYMHLIKGLTPLVLGVASLVFFTLGIKWADWNGLGFWCWSAIIGAIFSFICLLAFLCSPPNVISGLDHLMACVQIHVAPRIYLIEQVSQLFKH